MRRPLGQDTNLSIGVPSSGEQSLHVNVETWERDLSEFRGDGGD